MAEGHAPLYQLAARECRVTEVEVVRKARARQVDRREEGRHHQAETEEGGDHRERQSDGSGEAAAAVLRVIEDRMAGRDRHGRLRAYARPYGRKRLLGVESSYSEF